MGSIFCLVVLLLVIKFWIRSGMYDPDHDGCIAFRLN